MKAVVERERHSLSEQIDVQRKAMEAKKDDVRRRAAEKVGGETTGDADEATGRQAKDPREDYRRAGGC